jgi:ribosomal-protein-alanine N-acetyltransferase
MTGMRRLDAMKKGDLYERGRAGLVRAFDISRDEFDQLQNDHPGLIASTDTGLMLLQPSGSRARLSYAFDSIDSLRQTFRPMLDRLLASLDVEEAKSGIRLRFTDLPNRPYVEPVLADCLFELDYEWMQMDLAALPDGPAPSDEIAPGFVLRPAAAADYEAFAAIDAAAFGRDNWLPADFADAAAHASQMRMLEDAGTGRAAAYLILQVDDGRVGKVRVLAVHPDFQHRGLGEAMMRWSLASFRQQGMRRAMLNVKVDNPVAIALYRKLGFAPGRRGLVYRRPTGKEEIDKLASKRKGTYIKFGGWR